MQISFLSLKSVGKLTQKSVAKPVEASAVVRRLPNNVNL